MQTRYTIPLSIVLALFLTSCGGSAPALSSSSQAWVEYPYEGDILPMEPLAMIVYATAPNGINYIQILINGEAQPALTVSPLSADGSSRLARVDYAWTPPAEGQYVIEASGVDSTGASGGTSSTRFCIVTCNPPQESLPGQTADVTAPPTTEEIPTPSSADTAALPIDTQFYASPANVDAGNCSTLQWVVTTTETISVYYNGELVGASGDYQTCPCETETHTLQVVKLDGSAEEYYATVNVNGACGSEIPAPTTGAPPEPPPPSDTIGPSINSISTYWYPESCSLFGTADITDPSGVTWAEFYFNLNDTGWAWIQMNQSGTTWTSQVGVDTLGSPGTLVYKVHALDSFNNETWSGEFSRNFAYCGD